LFLRAANGTANREKAEQQEKVLIRFSCLAKKEGKTTTHFSFHHFVWLPMNVLRFCF